ncbi:MAG: hypothetical protein ABR533_07165, partial [Desulfonatronovibrio sp.]
DYPLLEVNRGNHSEIRQRLKALGNEIGFLEERSSILSPVNIDDLRLETYNEETANNIRTWLQKVSLNFRQDLAKVWEYRLSVEDRVIQELGEQDFELLQKRNFNQEIADLVNNVKTFEQIRLSGEHLVQVTVPIARMPDSKLGKAHFFAPSKRLGQINISTFVYNIIILWIMGLALFALLYYKLFFRILNIGR